MCRAGCLQKDVRRDGLPEQEPVERLDPEGFRERTRSGVGTGDRTGTWEIGAKNGCPALTSPRFGLETERSGRAGNRTDSPRSAMWKRRCRPGTLTSQWWRKRRCERAKGRTEFPVPAGCCAARSALIAETHGSPKGCNGERSGVHTEHPAAKRTSACRRVAESYREPWTF